MNLQLIAIINEFLNKPAKDAGLDTICNGIIDGGCSTTYEFSCNCCILARCNGDKVIAVHTHLNQIQVTREYTLTPSK